MLVNIHDSAQQSIDALGGKGYGLWQMAQAGLNVPKAIIIPTSVCRQYFIDTIGTTKWVSDLSTKIRNQLRVGKERLVSVRSGAKVSMPGMMDTILNVGITEGNQEAWAKKIGAKCAEDCRLRLINMYNMVVNCDPAEDIDEQLGMAIMAVFNSWNNPRAIAFRKDAGIPDDLGTAVVIQEMVFGNYGPKSCTGVVFTRNPDSGENEIMGEWLPCAQGEDIVAGTSTPQPMTTMIKWDEKVTQEVVNMVYKVENYYKDATEIEFTVEEGKLFVLQVKNAKPNAAAAVKLALDFYRDGMITAGEVFLRISPRAYFLAQKPVLAAGFKDKPYATGIPACSGVATGKVVYSAKEALDSKEPCILVTQETNPEDIMGMRAAVGILTMTGGATSHAAVVARAWDKPCIVGIGAEPSNFKGIISMDGASGRVWNKEVPIVAGGKAAVNELTELLFDQTGFTPIDYVGKSHRVFVDASRDVTDTAKVIDRVVPLVKAGKEVLLSFSEADWTSEEVDFYNQCGVTESVSASLIQPTLQKLYEALTEEERGKIKVIAAGIFDDNDSYGFGVLSIAHSLESLAMAESEILLPSTMVSSKAKEYILKKKQEDGVKVIDFASTFKSTEQLVGSLLGRTV